MGKQQGLQSLSYLNIKPAFLIVPLALEGTLINRLRSGISSLCPRSK